MYELRSSLETLTFLIIMGKSEYFFLSAQVYEYPQRENRTVDRFQPPAIFFQNLVDFLAEYFLYFLTKAAICGCFNIFFH